MNEEEKAKAIEKANSYRQMMESWAWKDLIATAEENKTSILNNILNGDQTTERQIGYLKGYRDAVDQIFKDHIGYVLENIK